MTTLANRKVIASKSSLSVMTGHTTERAWSGVMIERLRRRYAISPTARTQPVTFIATQTLLAVVLFVTKANLESPRRLSATTIGTSLVAQATRGNIPLT